MKIFIVIENENCSSSGGAVVLNNRYYLTRSQAEAVAKTGEFAEVHELGFGGEDLPWHRVYEDGTETWEFTSKLIFQV